MPFRKRTNTLKKPLTSGFLSVFVRLRNALDHHAVCHATTFADGL